MPSSLRAGPEFGTLDQKVKDMFDDFDEDESGFLEKDEVGELMAELGLTLEDEDLDEAIAGMEAKDDQDGKIGFPEFLVWWNEKGKVQKRESLKKTIAERKASELEVERLEKEGMEKAKEEKARLLAEKKTAWEASHKEKISAEQEARFEAEAVRPQAILYTKHYKISNNKEFCVCIYSTE